ncbi:MAG: ABC transporter permease [Candidatus Odinarchaeota archaeon]
MWKQLFTEKGFVIPLIVFTSIIGVCFIGTLIYPDYTKSEYTEEGVIRVNEKPSAKFPLGTTRLGYNTVVRLCWGTISSLQVGVVAGIISTIIATVIGSVGSYKGGILDETSVLITNVILVFPIYPLLLMMGAMLQPEDRNLVIVALVIALTSWPWAARATRGQILSLKERDFVNLARITGMNDFKLLFIEILPNMLSYLILVLVITMGGAIVAEAAISILGLGPDPNAFVTLGSMLFEATQWSYVDFHYWWLYMPPGIIITIFVLCLQLMHRKMDAIFNPRLREK